MVRYSVLDQFSVESIIATVRDQSLGSHCRISRMHDLTDLPKR